MCIRDRERVERPAHRVLDVRLVEHVQLVDDEPVAEAELLDLPPQIGGLRPKLSRREHAMSGVGESDGGSPAQTATRPRDQYAFQGLILKCWRLGSVDWLMSSRQGGSRNFAVLRGHTARHADRADERSVGKADRDATGIWNQTAVRALGRGSGPARLAVFPQTLARTVEEDRGLRFLQRDVD